MMVGQNGGMWRSTKFHIIYGSVYQLIGGGEMDQDLAYNRKMAERVNIRRTPGL